MRKTRPIRSGRGSTLLTTCLALLAVLAGAGCDGDETPSVAVGQSADERAVLTGPIRARTESEAPSREARGVVFHDENGDLWLMNPDGSDRRRLTRSGDGFDFDPDWSPDGRRIIFRTDRFAPGLEGIMIVDSDGSDERRLYGGGSFARWSPDGTRIALSGIDGKITLLEPDGSSAAAVGEAEGECPIWSPDGRRLAFCHLEGTKWDVWVVSVDGSGLKRLTHDPGNHYPRGWSPDGRKIVFWTQGNGPERLAVIRPNGSGQRRVTNLGSTYETLGGWMPDGRMIVGIDSPADGLHGWYALSAGGDLEPVLRSLERICCGEGQFDWR